MDQEALALLKEISAKIDTLIFLVESRMPPRITRNISFSFGFASHSDSSPNLTSEDYLNPFLHEGGLPDGFHKELDTYDTLSSEVLENFEKEV